MKKKILFCILLLSCVGLNAQKQTFVREYTYRASINDSEVSSREESIRQMKIELLEEIGVFVSSSTNISNREGGGAISESYRREIQSNAMGVIETRILDSKWDGRMYWVRAELKADVRQIQHELEEARKKWQAEELRRIQALRTTDMAMIANEQKSKKTRKSVDWSWEKGDYITINALSLGLPFWFGHGMSGRYGGVVGVGGYANIGYYSWPMGWTVESVSGSKRSGTDPHYSVGLKFFPYKKIFLSAGYGTVISEKVGPFNDSDGRWSTGGQRLGKGVILMTGVDIFKNFVSNNDFGGYLSIEAGMSYDLFMEKWLPAFCINFGFIIGL